MNVAQNLKRDSDSLARKIIELCQTASDELKGHLDFSGKDYRWVWDTGTVTIVSAKLVDSGFTVQMLTPPYSDPVIRVSWE